MKSFMMLTVAITVGFASARFAMAEPQTPSSYSGQADYQVFCASCHGPSAKGDGVMASALRKRPADLTQLTKKNDGTFPADAVFKTIESGHETADMPAWSAVLSKSKESPSEEAAKARIRALVSYLETLQPKN